MAKEIQLSAIRTDGGTQMRAELNRDVYMDYRDKWLAGEEFPPVVLFDDGSIKWLADGFHRFYGAREAKLKTIPADVRQGTVRDAILFAVAANQQHGLRRTNDDKRRAVQAILNDEEWVLFSDNRIAELCGVSVQFASNIRKELSTVDSSPAAKSAGKPRTGKDGKKRKPRRPAKPKQLPTPSPPSSHMNNNTGNSGGSKPSSGDTSAVAPRLHQIHKSIDAIFAPLGKLERKQLVQYINSKYAA